MASRYAPWIAAALAACATTRGQPGPDYGKQDYSDEALLEELHVLGAEAFGFEQQKVKKSGVERNAVGIRSETTLVSRRLDSRTFFVHDLRAGPGLPLGTFEGSDEELMARGRAILERVKIPAREQGRFRVLYESLQDAQIRKGAEPSAPVKGQRMLVVARAVEGLPVFDSHLKLLLARAGQVGFMELHWPEIPRQTLDEAHRLRYLLEHGWKPPDRKGARVESAEAGIVHSSALGLLMDIYPAIRVVYAPTEGGGKKPVLFYDRSSQPLPAPRQLDLPCPAPTDERPAAPAR